MPTNDYPQCTEVRLVVSDLDGTLLRNNLTISDRTLRTVATLRESGIPFAIATGRSFLGMKKFHEKLDLDTPAICYNGAAVFDGTSLTPLIHSPINAALTRRLISIGRENGLHTQFYLNERLLCESRNNDLDHYEYTTDLTAEIVNFDDFPAMEPTKGMYLGEPEKILAVQKQLAAEFGNAVYTATSKPRYLELLEGGVSKGSTLKKLLETMKINPQDVIAFGDGRNDYELLAAAGTGIAMPDGHRDLTEKFRICPKGNEEDGVAEYIENLLLK